MKTKTFSKKLTLNKKTIVNLNEHEMAHVNGGLYIKSQDTDCITCVSIFPCTTYHIPCHSTPYTQCMCD